MGTGLSGKVSRRGILAAGLVVGMGFLTGCLQSKDDKAIRETYDLANQALTSRDAAALAAHVSASTFTYFDRLLNLARVGTKAQVMSLPPSEMMELVMMRNRCTGAQLKNMTGPFWLKACFEGGDYYDMDGIELGSIKIRGDFAEASLEYGGFDIVDDSNNPIYFLFVKENGTWRWDIQHIDKWFNSAMESDAAAMNRALPLAILDWEAESSGKKPRSDIFDTPNAN